jgi:hypothetical protein
MQTEIITIYDENNLPYVVEAIVGDTRVIRVISGPTFPNERSQNTDHCDAGYMNDVRFGN